MSKEDNKIKKLIEYLSPNERKIIPFIEEKTLDAISEKSKIDTTSVLRALEYLSNKELLGLESKTEKFIELGVNGVRYLKYGLPERLLMNLLSEKNNVTINDADKITGLSDNELKASLGVLKKKALIDLINGRIVIIGSKKEISNKSLEEKFLESIPRKLGELQAEEKFAFENLKSRKDIIEIREQKIVMVKVTNLGKQVSKVKLDTSELIEAVTSKLIKTGKWKNKKFRKYDITSQVPKIDGGKRYFVNQSIEYGKKIWLEMGFSEMTGSLVQSGFWNFDALFTAQDHPVREMQDTFFIKDKIAKLPGTRIVGEVKKAHEGKIKGSKGWGGEWNEEDAKKVVLRTHTTCLSAKTLELIAKKKEFPAKYFAFGKCFRNETVDWSHGFEFNQTEGIVVDENANFRQLLGYLREFFRKMGYDKIRIRPGYFPYTEPSLEIDIFHPIHKEWVEFGGAGMFRPEVTIPIFGRHIPVLAWGPGFDRIIMEFFEIKDLREMYKNDISKLREMKIWDK